MVVYHGIVKDNVVVLEEDVHLTDGVAVEVHVSSAPASNGADKEALRARGLLQDAETPPPATPPVDRRPITVQGPPLSEMIIAERR